MPWTNIFRSLIKLNGLAIVWSTIHKLYGVGLNFGKPNCTLKFLVMILTLEPPSINTSSIKFLPTWTWITTN